MSKPGFDPNGRPLTVAAAKREINRIRSDRGHIDAYDEDQIARTDVEFQESYRRKSSQLREVYARYTRTVAEQLYSSRFRLIHELLQNADDARYAQSVVPTITFRVTPTELVVESNELGFSLMDVESICDTGKSSKIGDADTTGEKGLGFKSVFGIANNVHIQSGKWSFRFMHRRGDDGVGMITPVWTDAPSDLPSGVGTRCKLQYSDTRESFSRRLVSEFEKLPKTIIFALRQLSRLVVVRENVDGRSGQITFTKDGRLDSAEMHIDTQVIGHFGDHGSEKTRLRLFQTTVRDMPFEAQRTALPSTITIAFEVDAKGLPVIPTRGQHVFAYLPVQRLPQLPFLIQADFVLAANREAVPDSEWNQALRDGVAQAFVAFVRKLVTRGDSLEFKWMRYLPVQPMEGFWEDLSEDIKEYLQDKKVVRSWCGDLRTLAYLRFLPSWFLYEQEPLLPDNYQDIYLSPEYEKMDLDRLKDLGLKRITSREIVARLAEVRLDEEPLDDPWHTAVAALVERLLQNHAVKAEVQLLDIIPLNDESWVSLSSLRAEPVYFPYLVDEDSVRIELPEGLGLRKLHPTAAADGERGGIYMRLGISSCHHETAISKILDAHLANVRRGNVYDFVRDSEILFWFGRPEEKEGGGLFGRQAPHKDIRFVSTLRSLHQGRSLFLPSDEEYHAQKLLAESPSTDFTGFGFLNPLYLKSQVRDKIRHQCDWFSWLRKCGMSYFPRLNVWTSSGYSLSPPMKLIARDNPVKFVPNLREHWSDYQVGSISVEKELKCLPVPCQDGSKKPMSEIILPTQELLEEAQQLNMEHKLPFLQLPAGCKIQTPESWSFLKEFGMICDLNAAFYLAGIRLLSLSREEHLISVCSRIYAGIVKSTPIGDAETLQASSHQPLVRTRTTLETWCKSADCVWEGPEFLHAKNVLYPVYGADPNASTFFKTFLNMRNADHKDLVDELTLLSDGQLDGMSPSFEENLQVIYTSLADMARSDAIVDFIRRNEFNARGLIYARGKWWKPSECLWNCRIEISGRVPLEQTYPKLKNFFVDKMKVMPMSINVLVQELSKITNKADPDFDEHKRIMLEIGQLLAANPATEVNGEYLDRLKKTAFLPVRTPDGMRLSSLTENFCINDHKRYGDAFRNKTGMLDFDYEDLTSLHPFFELLKIEHRYLSSLVSAQTTVGSFSPSGDLKRHIRDRAYAMSCCANASNSPKFYNRNTSIHRLLQNAEVFVCENMWTELTLKQEHGSISLRSDRAVVKVEQSDEALAIYVPDDNDGLYSCFHTELPGELTKFLGIEDRGRMKTIYRILNDVERDLDTIMGDEDIPGYSWIDKPPTLPQPLQVPVAPRRRESVESDSSMSTHLSLQEDLHVDRPVTQAPVWQHVARTELYKKLLREVVRQARRIGDASTSSLSLTEIEEALNELENPLNYDELRRELATYGTFEENARIGAAGELFVSYACEGFYERALNFMICEVFELLKARHVSNFTIDNWRSSIRYLVSVLPEYAEEAAWTGREISDIMYKGNCSHLMDFLRQNTVHPYPPWLDSSTSAFPVQYHIEVKTTPGPCSTPFFMSENQYKLMRDKACNPQSRTAPADLFVIIRVFNLFSRNIGIQAYVNPWHLRDTVLEFVADPWKVFPCETPSVSVERQIDERFTRVLI
ncbi:uncharacterized protein Z518_00294 [Rhinocladiella mackenziei CBS 650.93]|uniref:Protein NO VEIN C-terminal domain-containing protein n=1 Tax=Rhinocladiella mackenziei CBS 650.93 TaxID=1442369 RepID=A0A0D2JIG2_9EURO|nr:uncharacterized protein Z518_00294 [Rhinocladiella mackenziei CBS 650.93]KIX09215.1 hypothetical protein Z518_00294 [Rhinocladiella mackenziei CBS 650.93]